MSNTFAEIAFTDKVKEVQQQEGSRALNYHFEEADFIASDLSFREMDFIESRDTFFQATVSETGWPYIQHRGGPKGFLKVLAAQTIGYADFRGNRQFLSVGNLQTNDRIALILVDFAQQRRLKLWGRASVVKAEDEPELIKQLIMPDYRAVVERAIVIKLEAWAWNCQQHITPRFTEAEIRSAISERSHHD